MAFEHSRNCGTNVHIHVRVHELVVATFALQPTSQIPDLSTDALLKPTSASLPHTCLFCYVGFPDTASLRQHCKTAAHVRTLLCDCGAATIWKHLPPPPDQLLQWKLCPKCVFYGNASAHVREQQLP